MKLIFKFKDGMRNVQNFSNVEIKDISGNGDFLRLMLKGKELNGDIEIIDIDTGKKVVRKYKDLHSVEIVFAD